MLRVVVESAKGLPKKKVGSPDPVTSVIFKGKSLWEVMEVLFVRKKVIWKSIKTFLLASCMTLPWELNI